MRNAINALLAAGLIALAAGCGAGADASETHVVEMRGLEFVPATVNAKPGDTILWVNADVVPHTATAADGSWDSGLMEAGDEWSVVIEQTGDTDFVCTFHPSMVGVISVD